jgi:hypothetical protein
MRAILITAVWVIVSALLVTAMAERNRLGVFHITASAIAGPIDT